MRVELIAAKAKQLAHDVKNGRLWEGELSSGLGEISQQLQITLREASAGR